MTGEQIQLAYQEGIHCPDTGPGIRLIPCPRPSGPSYLFSQAGDRLFSVKWGSVDPQREAIPAGTTVFIEALITQDIACVLTQMQIP